MHTLTCAKTILFAVSISGSSCFAAMNCQDRLGTTRMKYSTSDGLIVFLQAMRSAMLCRMLPPTTSDARYSSTTVMSSARSRTVRGCWSLVRACGNTPRVFVRLRATFQVETDGLPRQARDKHREISLKTGTIMNILAGTNPNEDEPQLGPGAASSGTGAIDVYYFHNTETGELRLYGTPGLVRAQAAQEQYAKTGSPDVLRHGALPPGMAPETEPAGVREERRAGANCMIIAPKRLKLRLSGSARKSQKRFRDTPRFKFPAVLARTQPFYHAA